MRLGPVGEARLEKVRTAGGWGAAICLAVPTGGELPRPADHIRQGSNELARIAFGSESKSPEGIYAKTSDGPAVKVITKSIFDNFSVKVEDLVETPPAPPPAPEKK